MDEHEHDDAQGNGESESSVHQHDHSTEDEESFWRGTETLVCAVAGLLFLIGCVIEFTPVNPVLRVLAGYELTLSSAVLLMALVIGSVYTVRYGLGALVNMEMSVDFLVTVAMLGALFLGKFVEAAALAVLYGVAERLEDYSMVKARSSLKELVELSPRQTTVRRDGREETVDVDEVSPGDTVIIHPGDKIPVDAVVEHGETTVNEASVTGESMPADKGPGDDVYAGTLNQQGYIECRATARAEDSTLAKIIHLVEQAEHTKAPSQRFVDQFSSYYTPSVVGLAMVIGLLVPAVLGGFTTWWLRAMALLVIACPCGLLISTPVTVVSGITSAANHGTLIKGGEPFENLGDVDLVCFDKTGTLTTGELSVSDVEPFGRRREQDVVRLAAAVESRSEHPLAEAIVAYARENNIDSPDVTEFESKTALGVEAVVDGTLIRVGKPTLFDEDRPSNYDELEQQRKTVVCVGSPEEIYGLIAISDTIRPRAQSTVDHLRNRGMDVVMITGDNEGTASAVAGELGIDHYHSNLMPEDKVDEINHLREGKQRVAMVGDGVNDAPALAAADVGVAMGAAGSDTALETADVALLGDNLSRIIYSVDLSRRGEAIIKQNIYASIGVKVLLGLGVIPGFVNLIMAVLIGDMGVAFGITANAMRLRGMSDQSGLE